MARTASIALKNRAHVYGGSVSQRRPLVRIFLKKCRNRYTTKGRPLHLVLHFAVGRQSPFEPQLNDGRGPATDGTGATGVVEGDSRTDEVSAELSGRPGTPIAPVRGVRPYRFRRFARGAPLRAPARLAAFGSAGSSTPMNRSTIRTPNVWATLRFASGDRRAVVEVPRHLLERL